MDKPFDEADDDNSKSQGTLLPCSCAGSKRPGWISERDWMEAGPSGTQRRRSPVTRRTSYTRPRDNEELRKLQRAMLRHGSPTSKRVSNLPQQDLVEDNASDTEQWRSVVKRRKPSTEEDRDVQQHRPQGTVRLSGGVHSSKKELLQTGHSVTGRWQAPVECSCDGYKTAETARTHQTATAGNSASSGVPDRHPWEDKYLRYEVPANRGVPGIEDNDEIQPQALPSSTVRSSSADHPSVEDPAEVFSRAFDELWSTDLTSEIIVTSLCERLSDADNHSEEDQSP